MTILDPQALADRYIAQWSEPDAARRRALVEELWAADGTHVLHPAVEIREVAAALGFDHQALEARGHAAIETRVSRSYERFVEKEGLTFRSRGDAVLLRDVVKCGWQTVAAATGDVLGDGLVFLVLDDEGRIRTDYMFPGA